MIDCRDYQRSKVYDWERAVIAHRDRSEVYLVDAQNKVNGIWQDQGLLYPPKVKRLPQQARRVMAHSSREAIHIQEITPSWCLLHELAHSMTSDHNGAATGHGPIFMGNYVRLLGQYLRISREDMHLDEVKVNVDFDALPTIIDPTWRLR